MDVRRGSGAGKAWTALLLPQEEELLLMLLLQGAHTLVGQEQRSPPAILQMWMRHTPRTRRRDGLVPPGTWIPLGLEDQPWARRSACEIHWRGAREQAQALARAGKHEARTRSTLAVKSKRSGRVLRVHLTASVTDSLWCRGLVLSRP